MEKLHQLHYRLRSSSREKHVLHLWADVGADIFAWDSLQHQICSIYYICKGIRDLKEMFSDSLFNVALSGFCSSVLLGAHLCCMVHTCNKTLQEVRWEIQSKFVKFNASFRVRRTSNLVSKVVQDEANGRTRQHARNWKEHWLIYSDSLLPTRYRYFMISFYNQYWAWWLYLVWRTSEKEITFVLFEGHGQSLFTSATNLQIFCHFQPQS
jgi:hypothetical protein